MSNKYRYNWSLLPERPSPYIKRRFRNNYNSCLSCMKSVVHSLLEILWQMPAPHMTQTERQMANKIVHKQMIAGHWGGAIEMQIHYHCLLPVLIFWYDYSTVAKNFAWATARTLHQIIISCSTHRKPSTSSSWTEFLNTCKHYFCSLKQMPTADIYFSSRTLSRFITILYFWFLVSSMIIVL